MSIKLDPATAAKIEDFGRRRRKLILMRGICTFVTITLLAFGVVGLLDYLIFMEDWVRYTLSSVAYVLLAIALYFTCLKQLTHKSTVQELALMFEMACPSMKEKLLSAVELSDHGKSAAYESNVFKDAIQKDVASQVGKIQLESILPKNLILKWTRAAVVTFAVFAILLFIPNLKFSTLMLRAVAPAANVDRVSSIEITLIEPESVENIVPEGDAVSVVIEISDPEINTAYMESIQANGKKDTVPMQKIDDQKFSTVINVGRDDISFRIRAHTALTKYYKLRAVPRPQVIEFEKTYEFPTYSALDPKTVTEKKGDIRILEGTEVKLNIKADQPVKSAELRFENAGGKSWKVPLNVVNKIQLQGSFKVKSNATYKVHIVAEESGFINKFSPKYEVQSLADLLPSIALTLPKSDMAVPADDVIDIRGNADDDLGLKEVFISYKHNTGSWKNLNIIKTNLKTLPISKKWELSQLKVEPGDEVTFRLGARDRKGNEGFSSSIKLSIVADGFDRKRLTAFQEFIKIHKSLNALSQLIKENSDSANKGLDGDPLKAKQKFVQLSGELDSTVGFADDVLKSIKRSTSLVGSKVPESDLVLVGRVVSYIKNSMIQSAADQLISAVNETDRNAYNGAKEMISKATHTSKKLAELFKTLVAANGSGVIAGDLYKILEEQQNLDSIAFQQNVSTDQLKRRQNSLMKNVTNTDQLITKASQYSEQHFQNQYKTIKDRIQWTQQHSPEVLNRKPKKMNGHFTEEFFADEAMRDKKQSRKSNKITHNWSGSPAGGVPKDFWSARWTGGFKTEKAGKHQFVIKHDGGIRLWVDERLLINDWIPKDTRENKVELNIDTDQTVRIRLDYRDDVDKSTIKFQVQYPDGKKSDIKPSKFEKYHLTDLSNYFRGMLHMMINVSRDYNGKSQWARTEIKKLLKEESKQIKEAAKNLEELAKAEEKLDKAIQEKKSKEEQEKLKKDVAKKAEKAEKSLEKATAQLEERAELEEKKEEADSQFVEDVAKTAKALENMKEDSAMSGEKAAEKAEKLAKALEDLEKGHELKEAKKNIEKMIANEENEDDPRKKVTENPELFKKTEQDLQKLKDELAKAGDEESKKMAEDLNKALHDHETNQTRDEMRHREHADKANKDVSEQLEKMQDKVAQAAEKHEEKMDKAREAINEESPTIGDQLEKLANEARENQKETKEALANLDEAKAEDVQQQAKEMQKKQEDLNDKLEDMRKALRREANAQDTSTQEGIEKARDADDALAMIQQPPPKAEEMLNKAANSEDKAEQQEALDETNKQQERIAEALEKLSEHFNKEDKQELADSRDDLRKEGEEKAQENGLQEEYEKAEAVADTDKKSIDEQIADLEKALAKDENMQKELAQIAQDTAEEAAQKLQEAAKNEQQIDQQLDKQKNENAQKQEMKKQAPQQQQNQQKTEEAAQDLERSAKHQQRLENNQQTDAAQQAAEQAQQASEKMEAAQQELQNAEDFQQAQQAVEEAKEASQEAANKAEALQNAQEQALANAQEQAAQQGEQAESPSQEASKQMAQALDQLDQAKQAQEQAQQAAQEAKEAAQQAQQQASQAQQSQQAQQAAQQAQQAAEQAQQAAQQASAQQSEQGQQASVAEMQQQAQQAQQAAQQAMQQAQQSAQQAQQSQNQAQQAAAQAQMAQAQAQQASAQAQEAAAQAQQAMQQAQQAMQQAQQSQSQAMAQARQPSQTPGSEPSGQDSDSTGKMAKVDPEKLKQEEEWAKLPKRLARDLRNAKQENVPEQYRKMVNTYFKIIAEQSKDKEAKK